jgi:hypothetical protein
MHFWQSKGLWKAGLRIWVTNSALRASFLAIKKVIQGGIARMGTALCASPLAIKWAGQNLISKLTAPPVTNALSFKNIKVTIFFGSLVDWSMKYIRWHSNGPGYNRSQMIEYRILQANKPHQHELY